MSRHSKNNTAHSIFTQGEKHMLESDKWGTNVQRIGRESFKQFSCCGICLGKAQVPTSCRKGHLFCRECILENICHQRKEYKEKIVLWKEQSEYRKALKNEESEKIAFQKKNDFERLEEAETGQAEFEKFDQNRRYGLMEEEKKVQAKAKDFLRDRDKKIPSKKEMLKKNYWIPDTTPDEEREVVEKPKKKITCPEGSHRIKAKELVKVICKGNVMTEELLCEGCCEAILYKNSYLMICGHLFCSECFKNCIEHCLSCSQPFSKKEVIIMTGSGTMFSAHNKVQAKMVNPAFQC